MSAGCVERTRGCVQHAGRESIKLYSYWADVDLANARRPSWDSHIYQLLDVLAATQSFTATSQHIFINRETRSLPVTAAGLCVLLTTFNTLFICEEKCILNIFPFLSFETFPLCNQ